MIDLKEAGVITDAPQAEPAPEADPFDALAEFMKGMQDSMAGVHIHIKLLEDRLASAERHISYLLLQDPRMGPKLRGHLEKDDAK
jgi:hypothetical protein